MINLIANEQFKKMGCKWQNGQWRAPELCEQEVYELQRKFYGDLIAIEVILTPGERFEGYDWAYCHARTIAGYIIATAKGRDSGAIISEGIAVMQGKFTSGGSVKNYICDHSENVTLRMKVSRNLIYLLDREVQEGRYTYKIMNQEKSLETLNKEKEELLNKLQEIENQISNITVI